MQTITLPEGKTIRMGDERYKLAEQVEVPAEVLEPVKKQPTLMRKLTCPVCGTLLRGTAKYRDRILICAGTAEAEHEGVFMVWADDTVETKNGE